MHRRWQPAVRGRVPTKVVHQISQRVIRKLRKLGYLESGIDAAVATGHDSLVHDEPELTHRLAASVQPHIAC
jgi:hypothetical protein